MDSVKCYQPVDENQPPLKKQGKNFNGSCCKSESLHNIQAEPLCVLSISEKVNGWGHW